MSEEPVVEGDIQAFEVDMNLFRDSLPEEVRNETIIKEAKDIGTIAKMAVDNKRMVGQKVEEFLDSIPTNSDDPTARDSAYSKLGWPGADGKYEVIRPGKVDGLEYSEAQEATFLNIAKELRLNNTQVNTLLAMQSEMQKGVLAENLKAAEAADEALKAEWGDKHEGNKAEVKAIIEKFGDEGLANLFNETELGNNASFARFVHEIGAGLIEKNSVGQGDPIASSVIAKEEAQKKVAENLMNTDFAKAYEDVGHPDHAKVHEEQQKLFDIIHGTKAVA